MKQVVKIKQKKENWLSFKKSFPVRVSYFADDCNCTHRSAKIYVSLMAL